MTCRRCLLGALVVLAAVAAVGAVGPSTAAASSPTYVDGDVTENTTWSAADGPYYVGRNLTIAPDATLTVAPGTRVNVGEAVTITVRGSLLATGTAADPVQFTTADAASGAGTWETIEYAGDSDSTLRLTHTVVEHGATAVTATSSAGTISLSDVIVREHARAGVAVRTRAGAPSIHVANSRFADLGRAGVVAEVPAPDPYVDAVRGLRIARTTFANTGTSGVLVRARRISNVRLTDVTVAGTSGAGVAFETESTNARPTITNDHRVTDVALGRVTIENAGGHGVVFRGGALADVAVTDSNVRGASGSGLHVDAATDADRVRFAGNTVVDSRRGLRVALRRTAGGIQHVSLAVAGNTFSRNDRRGLHVTAEYVFVDAFDVRNNTLAANGAGGARVATQQLNNTVFADNVVRANGGPGVAVSAVRVRDVTANNNRLVGNDGDGLAVRADDLLGGVTVGSNDVLDNDGFGVAVAGQQAGNTLRLHNNTLRLHNNTVVANENGVRVVGPTPTRLANNSIVLNTAARERPDGDRSAAAATGVVVETAPNVTLVHNDIYGHLVGLRSATDGTVVAEHNYWGAASGPYHETLNPSGAGDAVVTDRGKADPVPFASEPFGPRYERPTAVLTANETTVRPGEPVRFSADQSTDDGAIATYEFTVAGERRSGGEATRVASFAEPGTYEVSLAVVDEMGVRSLNGATVNVTVQAARQPTAGPTTTTSARGGQSASSLLGSLFSLWGLLGALWYVIALALGCYGTWLSVRGAEPPVSGRTVHALAALGVLTWAVAGVLADGALLTLAVGGAVAWGAATAVVLAAATR